jgi:hypothetical protein
MQSNVFPSSLGSSACLSLFNGPKVLLNFTDRFLTVAWKYPVTHTESRLLITSSTHWQAGSDANALTLSDFAQSNRVDMIVHFVNIVERRSSFVNSGILP